MNHWTRWLPGLDTLRRYEAEWLPHDIFAGLAGDHVVPVGIAYAEASGLPGIYGRASLQADTLRLHERNCIDRIDQPTAKALRFLAS
jgi:hypothetical protein